MTFLKINNLSVNYEMRRETVHAAKEVNINVEKGEILGLVGESGSGSGFTPGDIVGAVGCGATYESFLVTFVFSCDFENGYYLGDIAEDGTFTSQQIGPVPTVAEGTCVIVGTDPDNNPDTDDGEAAVLCSR